MLGLVIVWLLFVGAVYEAVVVCSRAGRRSFAAGIVVRVLSSLILCLLGCGLGLAHMIQLSACFAGNYQTWLVYGGWWVGLATGIGGGILPWLVWPRDGRAPQGTEAT